MMYRIAGSAWGHIAKKQRRSAHELLQAKPPSDRPKCRISGSFRSGR
jgi:hypothetical protein